MGRHQPLTLATTAPLAFTGGRGLHFKESMKPIYHYTTGDRLIPIIEAGQINPATKSVLPPELPAVWLSVASQWEQTASKGIIEEGAQRAMTLGEMIEAAGSLCRIEIDPEAVRIIPPLKLKERLKIDRIVLASLVESAREAGANPSEWRAVAGPIPISAFVSVELAKEFSPLAWTAIDF